MEMRVLLQKAGSLETFNQITKDGREEPRRLLC